MHHRTTSKDDVCSSVPSTQSQVDLSEEPDLQRSRLYSLMLDQILSRTVAVCLQFMQITLSVPVQFGW